MWLGAELMWLALLPFPLNTPGLCIESNEAKDSDLNLLNMDKTRYCIKYIYFVCIHVF